MRSMVIAPHMADMGNARNTPKTKNLNALCKDFIKINNPIILQLKKSVIRFLT